MRWLLIASGCLAGALLSAATIEAQSDACSGQTLEKDEIGVEYQNHCIAVDTTGPPVQSVIVQRTEGLDGAESVHGILVVRTIDGWKVEPDEWFADKGIDKAEVGDSGYLLIDAVP